MEELPGPGGHEEWDRFVCAEKNGTIFHTAWWHRAWGAEYKIFVRRDKLGRIESGILTHMASFPGFMGGLGVKGIRRPPLTPINGPVFRECPRQGRYSRISHEKKELISAIEALPRIGFYDFGLGCAITDLMPFIWNGFDTHVNYTYVIPVSEAAAWEKNMYDKARRSLKAARQEAAKSGCRIETDPPLEEARRLFFETSSTKGFSIMRSEDRLPRWWSAVRERNAGRTYILRDADGRGLSATLMVWDGHSAYCLLNGMARELRKGSHLNMLLFERMINDAHEMGLDYDFDGSTLMGVERFFRGWGGELHQKCRVVKIPSALAYMAWKAWRYLRFHKRRGWVSPA